MRNMQLMHGATLLVNIEQINQHFQFRRFILVCKIARNRVMLTEFESFVVYGFVFCIC